MLKIGDKVKVNFKNLEPSFNQKDLMENIMITTRYGEIREITKIVKPSDYAWDNDTRVKYTLDSEFNFYKEELIKMGKNTCKHSNISDCDEHEFFHIWDKYCKDCGKLIRTK